VFVAQSVHPLLGLGNLAGDAAGGESVMVAGMAPFAPAAKGVGLWRAAQLGLPLAQSGQQRGGAVEFGAGKGVCPFLRGNYGGALCGQVTPRLFVE
jgi:hypothetical protein